MPKPDKTPVKQSNDINHQAIKGLAKTTVGILFRSDRGEEFYSETRYTLLGGRKHMAAVVFMRGVNVGGHKPFRPAAFAKELSALQVINIGAAGTFVVRKTVSQAALRAELLRRLPVKAEFMICPARDLAELMSADPFPRADVVKDMRRFVSVLANRPSRPPRFPLSHPAGDAWQVKLVALRGRFVLSVWRRTGKALVYPNEVVEKELAIAATTRNWDTISKIHEILQGS